MGTFTDANGKIIRTSSMEDEHQIIRITEKIPDLQNIGRIVAGDTNSNILTFEINRYYDGVDLYQKNVRFIVKNKNGVFMEKAVNELYNQMWYRFSWILSFAVTQYNGKVEVAIEFYGTSEGGGNYSLKTVPFYINVENSIDATDITVEPPENWFVSFETRLSALENVTNTDTIVEEVINNLNFVTEDVDWDSVYGGDMDESNESDST